MSQLSLKVVSADEETPLVKRILIQATDGLPLPGFTPGAHIRVSLPDGSDRPYSLTVLKNDASVFTAPSSYQLGVRLEEDSQGGSVFMHGLKLGDTLSATQPKNDFPLETSDTSSILIAGGIGITPVAAMAARLTIDEKPFKLHYAGRSRGALAFVEGLSALVGENLAQHYDDEPETAFDIDALLASAEPDQHLYVCGPKGMIEAVQAAARTKGWPESHIHFELFTSAVAEEGDTEFEIELASSGKILTVPVGKTIIEVLEEAGEDPLYDCQRGDCGICQTTVLEGEPDHRDVVLTDAEKATGDVMQICVSRAKSAKLVLDI